MAGPGPWPRAAAAGLTTTPGGPRITIGGLWAYLRRRGCAAWWGMYPGTLEQDEHGLLPDEVEWFLRSLEIYLTRRNRGTYGTTESNNAVTAIKLKYPLTPKLIKRFWTYVDKHGLDDCWPWLGYRNQNGYGRFNVEDRVIYAHRYAKFIQLGKTLPRSIHVLHKCDNPCCCNPNHSFLGDQEDNMRDSAKKGRHRKCKGSKQGNSKLTEENVLEIRRLFAQGGITKEALARRYGVNGTLIGFIIRRKAWTHI